MARRKFQIRFSIVPLMVLTILFIGIGDSILPEPLKSVSYRSRTAVNNFIIGLFPSSAPKLKPYERTKEALEQEQQGSK